MNIYKTVVFLTFASLLFPGETFANRYTLPIDLSDSDNKIFATFDHGYSDDAEFVRFDGNIYLDDEADLLLCNTNPNTGEGCYDGHRGIDFSTSGIGGKEILAAAPGIIHRARWENTNDPNQGYGFHVAIYNADYDQSTVYGHMASTSIVSLYDVVTRGEVIGSSSDTGLGGYHLHFGVYDGDGFALYSADQTDPYGWSGTGTDPWPNAQGYLWTTDPPSFTPPTTATSTIYVSSNITATTTWTTGNVYVINSGNYSVASGVTLYIQPGVVIKFSSPFAPLTINGTLEAIGTSTNKIYFTSLKDDSVGGDTNTDGNASSPAAGDWNALKVGASGTVNLNDVVLRYGGGFSNSYGPSYANLVNYGGNLQVQDTDISMADSYGIHHVLGTTTIENSEIHDQYYGITASSGFLEVSSSTIRDHSGNGIQASGDVTVSVQGNHFLDNVNSPISLSFSGGLVIQLQGNDVSNSYTNGVMVSGNIVTPQTLTGSEEMPYVISGNLTIPNGGELTLDEDVVLKFMGVSSRMVINDGGRLIVDGDTSSPVHFTSINDDSVGGDTNNNGSSTNPAPDDWNALILNSGAEAELSYLDIAYGGSYHPAFGPAYANILNNGGILEASNSTFREAYNGIRQYSGSSIIEASEFRDNDYGIAFWDGSLSVATSTFSGNTTYGIHSNGSTPALAENNYWDDPSGPYHATLNPTGSGNAVSNNVDFTPWLTAAP